MRFVCLPTLALALALPAISPAQSTFFGLRQRGAVEAKLPYYPVQVPFSADKPASVTKEPKYLGTPKYGFLTVGNGPNSKTAFVLDEPAQGEWKIYIDRNQNGDLTDDGDGAWNKKTDNRGRTLYGVMDVTLMGSYKTATGTLKASSTLGIYRFGDLAALLTYRQSSRNGSVTLGGKTHKAILVENDADGLYNKTVTSAAEAQKGRPVWLMVDTDDKGTFKTRFDIRAPFKYEKDTYEAFVSAEGSKVELKKSSKVALDLAPKQQEAPALLAAGVAAPEFTAEKWEGGDLKLSDYKGKIVILDFWATWCGPCQKSMPHVQEVYNATKDKDVVVIGVCVWDTKEAYKEWVPQNHDKYTFQLAFDPAGRDSANSIAGKLYKVSGIPTTYIIGKDGKVVSSIVGYSDGDKRVEEALKKAGVDIK